MHSIFHNILVSIGILNLIILAMLLSVYIRNYRHIRSKFNLGLLLFSTMFFIENALIVHLAVFEWPELVSEIIALHLAAIYVIQVLGLLALLYITWK